MPTKQENQHHPIDNLGHFEMLSLAAVTTLGEEGAYGLAIYEEIKRLGNRGITSLGSVYTTLERLEKKGMVSSRFADETTDRGGRPRKYFKIEASGARALKNSLRQAETISIALRTAEGLS